MLRCSVGIKDGVKHLLKKKRDFFFFWCRCFVLFIVGLFCFSSDGLIAPDLANPFGSSEENRRLSLLNTFPWSYLYCL